MSTFPSSRAGLLALAGLLSLNSVHAAEWFVSPNGDDGNVGTKDQPFQTLAGAQQQIRKSGKLGKEPVILSFMPGNYELNEPVTLTPQDSGSEAAPVVYRSLEEGQAVISGGVSLDLDWKPYRDGIWQAKAPAGLEMDQLFINGTRQHMARYPNVDPAVAVFDGFAADAFSKERAARWKNPAGGYMHAIHNARWGGVHYRITGKDAQGELTYEGGWQNNRGQEWHKTMRMVENIFEELDAPGEWFHDRESGLLYCYPPEGVDLQKAELVTVQLAHLIDLVGTKQNPVRWISFQGFTFRHTARTFMLTKEPLLRSDWTIYRGGAVTFTGTRDCALLDCTFDSPGGNAVFVNKWNRRIAVKGSHFKEVGASAVAFVGSPDSVRNPKFEYGAKNHYNEIDKTPGPKSDDYPADCLVEDCLMARTGRIEKQGAGVQVSMSHKITIRHCSIYDTSRAGINFSEGTFGGHLIEFCDVFDTVLETGDHGSFNSWGRDRFWALRGAPASELFELSKLDILDTNIIRNSRWRCDHGWDIDLDDGSSDYEIYNNLMLNRGLKLREGFRRKVYNNIAVNNTMHAHVWYPNNGDEITGNIWMRKYGSALMRKPEQFLATVNRNMFVREDDRAAFQDRGWDQDSIVGNPMFVDPANGDFTVGEGSPFLSFGFKNFPMDQFGVKKPTLRAIARVPEFTLPKIDADMLADASHSDTFDWNGATVKNLVGEEFSAFGVSAEEGGVHIIKLSPASPLAKAGLKQVDLIRQINGKPVRNITDFKKWTRDAEGKASEWTIVRNQQEMKIQLQR